MFNEIALQFRQAPACGGVFGESGRVKEYCDRCTLGTAFGVCVSAFVVAAQPGPASSLFAECMYGNGLVLLFWVSNLLHRCRRLRLELVPLS